MLVLESSAWLLELLSGNKRLASVSQPPGKDPPSSHAKGRGIFKQERRVVSC